MAGFSGNGQFVRFYNWVFDKAAGIKISFNRADDEDGNFADGLSSILTKDGQQTATGPIPFASGLRVSDGTALIPGIAFVNDPDTGIYRIGANNIAFATGGAKVLDIATATASLATALVLGTPLTVTQGGRNGVSTDSARVSYVNAFNNDVSNLFTTNSGATVKFNTIDHDTNSMAATATTAAITIKTTGTYLIVVNMQVEV